MKTELSFLMDLFLNEEVAAPIKKLVADRIREVEGMLVPIVVPRGTLAGHPLTVAEIAAGAPLPQQSPSMLRIMQQHPEVPVVVAQPQTPAAAAALQQRADIIRSGMKEKPEAGRTGPRKF